MIFLFLLIYCPLKNKMSKLTTIIPINKFKKYVNKHLEKFSNIKINNKGIISLSIISSQILAEIIESLGKLDKDSFSYDDFKELLYGDMELKFISDKIEYFVISSEEITIRKGSNLTKYINIIKEEIFKYRYIIFEKQLCDSISDFIWLIVFYIINNILNNNFIRMYNMDNYNIYNHTYIIDQKDIMYIIDNITIMYNQYGAIKNNILVKIMESDLL